MDCKETRELIVAEFADGEAGSMTSREVHAHLVVCPACSTFNDNFRERAIEPFREFAAISPPDDMWHEIKGELRASGVVRADLEEDLPRPSTEVSSRDDTQGFLSRLLGALSVPRPAIAAAAVAVILIGVYVLSPVEDGGVQSYVFLEDDMEFLYSLGSYDETTNGVQFVKLGTSIEEYFL